MNTLTELTPTQIHLRLKIQSTAVSHLLNFKFVSFCFFSVVSSLWIQIMSRAALLIAV